MITKGTNKIWLMQSKNFIKIVLSGKGRNNSWDPLWQGDDLQINANEIRWLKS
jgi:hypothetical protein